MKKSDSFLEDRIRWKAKKHYLPSKHTIFWEDRSSELNLGVSSKLGNAVLVSSSDAANFIVVCTRGAIVVTDGEQKDVLFSDVVQITDFPMEPGEQKEDLTRLMFKLNNGRELAFSPEPYKTAFSVWNILLMLQRMS